MVLDVKHNLTLHLNTKITIKFHIYKTLQARITIYIIQIHQQNNLLKSQLLVFKLKLTILEISLISRGSLFHKSAPEYLKDLRSYIVLKRQCNIHKTLPSYITMLLIYPRNNYIKIGRSSIIDNFMYHFLFDIF